MIPAPVSPNDPAAITKSKMLTVPSPLTSPVSFSASVISSATVMVVWTGSAKPSAFSALITTEYEPGVVKLT
jgi:hypothetical protein